MSKKQSVEEKYESQNGLCRLLADGSEVLDSRPMALPVGFERPETIQELIRRLVTDRAMREELEASGAESFADADDFDVDDDLPVTSPYEEVFDPLHLATRDQEVASGTVQPVSQVDLDASRKLVEEHRKDRRKVPSAPVSPKVPDPTPIPPPDPVA